MAKKKTNTEQLSDGTYLLIAISSLNPDYNIAYSLNKAFNIELSNKNISEEHSYSETNDNFYKYTDTENNIHYTFCKNRNENTFLLPEIKNVDYIFLIQTEEIKTLPQLSYYLTTIRKIQGILAALQVRTNKLKNIQNLLQ